MGFIELAIQNRHETNCSIIRLDNIVAVGEAPGEPGMSAVIVCVGGKADSFKVCETYTRLRDRIIEAARKDG